jgi:hypothetical protein
MLADSFSDASQVKFPFQSDGFLHELLEQSGPVALVNRGKPGRQCHYEVVVLQRHQARNWPNGRFTPEGWHYPTSQQWGTYAWTYTDLAKAREKYDVRSKIAREHVRQSRKGEQKLVGNTKTAGGGANALNQDYAGNTNISPQFIADSVGSLLSDGRRNAREERHRF